MQHPHSDLKHPNFDMILAKVSHETIHFKDSFIVVSRFELHARVDSMDNAPFFGFKNTYIS